MVVFKNKAEIRSVLVAKRLNLTMEERIYASEEICHRLWDVISNFNAKTVAVYSAMHNEVDLTTLIDKLELHNITLCLPRVEDEEEPLVFNEWLPSEDVLDVDSKGIPCVDGEVLTPDVVIVPLVGFDRSGGRIGTGNGYYDRTLAELPRAIRVGAAYVFQEVDDIMGNDHDIPLHFIATDAELIEAE